MLNNQQLKDGLKRVTYKPEFSFYIYEPDDIQGVYILIEVSTRNAYNSKDTVQLEIKSPVPPMRNSYEFHRWLLWRIKQIELHELLEWFKIDGECMIDPHDI